MALDASPRQRKLGPNWKLPVRFSWHNFGRRQRAPRRARGLATAEAKHDPRSGARLCHRRRDDGPLRGGGSRYDLVAMLALLASVAVGIVPADQAFTGFGDDIVIIVASALLVSAAVPSPASPSG